MNEDTNQNQEIKVQNETDLNKKEKKNRKIRRIIVLAFLTIFLILTYISLRGTYLEFLELGDNYTEAFWTKLKYTYSIIIITFMVLYIIMYLINRGIKKGLKVFFEQEKKEFPKLPNKSIAFVVSVLVSVLVGGNLAPKAMSFFSGASFEVTDPIFNIDISYYTFMKPVIDTLVLYIIIFTIMVTAYMILYYVIVFNMYFDGIDKETLKQSGFIKKVVRNAKLVAIGGALLTVLNVQSILFQKFITLDDGTELIGAGLTEATVKLWGYIILSVIIVVSIFKALNRVKESNFGKAIKSLLVIPVYLICLFVIMVGFDFTFVKVNELDKEKEYISNSIKNTKNAYNIEIEEENVNYSGTVTFSETQDNQEVINNVTVISKDAVLNTLKDSQTGTGYYLYRNATIGKYEIDGEEKLVYLSPREINSRSRTYNNKTYEYTHGIGEIITSATEASAEGKIEYIQNDISGKDNVIEISQPRIYFGLETNDTIATNTTNKVEYDYTDETGEHDFSYDGKAGLQLGFMDRLILGIRKGDINLAFSGAITKESNLLINRNVIQRAKTVLPDLIYDSNPYTVIDNRGNIIWVLDAYTTSDSYPYSSYITIEYDNSKQKINYIRNSIKVLINSYTGEMRFYITDRTDPIAMAYRNIYPTVFEDLEKEIPQDISSKFVYPQYLYNIQAKMIETFHNVKYDVLYRSDDIWDLAKFNTTQTTKNVGSTLDAYYTMINTKDEENATLGLVQMYTPVGKQNVISYLVGTCDGVNEKLKLYKFNSDDSILGPMQLDKQIEQDETISAQIDALNVTGAKITKRMIVVPIENTLLYVEPIYQTMLNESDIPILKKVIVASGSKVAIGNELQEALGNLLSQYAVNIEVENTDNIDGLIESIIKANNNLTDSNKSNNWEQMGTDIKKLQELINSLQRLQEQEKAKKADAQKVPEVIKTENNVNENVAVEEKKVNE